MSSEDIDIDTTAEDDDVLLDEEDEESLEEAEPAAADLADAASSGSTELGEVESIQDILAKQETKAEEEEAAEEEEEAAALATMSREEKLEPADSRVVPMQSTEFMCKRCFLVKHRSQLADKKRTYCRDCA
jgi:hypothetical protein